MNHSSMTNNSQTPKNAPQTSGLKRIKNYFLGVGKEYNKIQWITKTELKKIIFVVLGFIIIFALVFMAVTGVFLLIHYLLGLHK